MRGGGGGKPGASCQRDCAERERERERWKREDGDKDSLGRAVRGTTSKRRRIKARVIKEADDEGCRRCFGEEKKLLLPLLLLEEHRRRRNY